MRKRENKPYDFANVRLENELLKKYASVDGKGHFSFEDVPPGNYVLTANALGLVSQSNSIHVVDSLKTYNLDIFLSEATVDSNPETEKYHQRLQKENNKFPILTLTIEHFVFRNGFVIVYPSVRNNTDMFFYMIRPFECINSFSAIIKDENGKDIGRNTARMDCVGEKIYPTRDDLIPIPEKQIVDCPPVTLEFYDFSRLPEGIYTLQLKYEYDKPPYLGGQSFGTDYRKVHQDEINTLIIALRGEYISSNSIEFKNRR